MLKREKIKKELFATEKVYIDGLKLIVEKFYEPLLQVTKAQHGTNGLTIQHVHSIFNPLGIRLLLSRSLAFQEALTCSDGFDIGTIVVRHMALLKSCYTQYCSAHEQCRTKIIELEANMPMFRQFLKDKQLGSEPYGAHVENPGQTNAVDLHSLLISPVQRFPRYHLLLSELASATTKIISVLKMSTSSEDGPALAQSTNVNLEKEKRQHQIHGE